MKFLIFILLFCSFGFSQETDKSPLLIEVYGGGLNEDGAYRRWIKKHNEEASFLTTGGTNPIGIRVDFLRKRRFTFGLDFMYNYGQITLLIAIIVPTTNILFKK